MSAGRRVPGCIGAAGMGSAKLASWSVAAPSHQGPGSISALAGSIPVFAARLPNGGESAHDGGIHTQQVPVKKFLLPLVPVFLSAFAALSASAGLFPFPIAVNGDDVTVAVAADASWLSGEAGEHLYLQNGAIEGVPGGRRLSRLDWDLRNVWLVGGAGSIRTCRFSLNAGIWGGAGFKASGTMESRNWAADGASGTDGRLADAADGLSRCDATVTSAFIVDGNASFDLFDGDRPFALYPFAGFRLERFEWEAENGWTAAGGTHSETPGKHVEYDMECVQPYVGLGGSVAVGRRFALSAYGRFSPVYRAKDHDKRLPRECVSENRTDSDWLDDVAYGAGLRAEWAIKPGFSLAASLDWSRYAFAKTKTKVLDSGVEDEEPVEEPEDAEEGEKEEKEEKPKEKTRKKDYSGTFGGLELENLTVSLGLVWRF